MAYSSQQFQTQAGKNKGAAVTLPALAKLQRFDTGAVAGGAGYTLQTWLNDAADGGLGPTVLARLNRMSASLKNSTSYGPVQGFRNDDKCGHIGPDLLARLNLLEIEVARLNP